MVMHYDKQPLDYACQLQTLRERGLRIADKNLAMEQLHSISYFRLAGYLRYMEEDETTRRFKAGSWFEDAIALYQFDNRLRSLIFTAIQDVEIALRTRVIHFCSMRHGAFWHMEAALFKNAAIYQHCLESIRTEVSRSKEDFIQEYFSKYSRPELPPVWKTLEVVSFGTLSKLYCNLSDTAVKKQIAKSFGLPQYVYLESWIKCAAVLRNCCAHHARIWNRRFPLIPRLPGRLPLPWGEKAAYRPVKLYAHVCYLAYLEQSVNPNGDFKGNLLRHLQANEGVNFRQIGFPPHWQDEPLWKSGTVSNPQ